MHPTEAGWRRLRKASDALRLTLVPAEARGLSALEQAFAAIVREHAQVLVVLSDGVLFNYRSQIGVLALRDRLPAISSASEYAKAGLLLTYGPDLRDLFRRSAVFVDKIFKGAKPADLPIEQPIKYELVMNKTGSRCGHTTARATSKSDLTAGCQGTTPSATCPLVKRRSGRQARGATLLFRGQHY